MSTEMDHLRAFRAADGTPDPDARAAARAALLEQVEHAIEERSARVPRPERIEDGAVRHRAAPRRARVPVLFATDPATGRRPRGRLLVGGVGLAVAGALAVALVFGLGSGGVQPTDASAAQLLRRAAEVADRGPDVALRAGEYWYTRSESTSMTTFGDQHPFAVLLQIRRESWIGRDGGGYVRQQTVGEPRFVGAGGRAAWVAAGQPPLGADMDAPIVTGEGTETSKSYPFGSDGLTYAELLALPTDTDALYARVRKAAHDNHNSAGDAHEMFTIVGDLLREAPTPAALRAALYRVAARVPGVELLGKVHDAIGRPGVAVALGEPHERSELVFDPKTAELLGERDEMDGQPAFESAYLESGVVDSTSARP